MKLKYKDMIKALNAVENERNIPVDVIKEALKEAMAKAYKKNAELSDIEVVAEINEKTETIDLFQYYTVVEDVMDDELEMSVADAQRINPSAQLGDKVCREIEIDSMSRSAATLARNVMRQKIREAEKIAVYDEYIDKLNDCVNGTVESVKDKFTLVNLGKTVAVMPHSAGLPGERLVEGQPIRVVITEVNKDTKGSQVLVSRADPMLVRRLFEAEVTEIYDGTVEIKSIAREAGERTKMAVMSHDPNVDPIGACIGPKGVRVQKIINALNGEKIDIFQWNDDLTVLVKNALAPAEVREVLPGNDDRSLLVIVDEDQLSLAIGKRGKNARLAVKLTNHKIDIKTMAELEDKGIDYEALKAAAEEKKREYALEAERKAQERMERENKEAEKKIQEKLAKLNEKNGTAEYEADDFMPEEMMDNVSEMVETQMTYAEEPAEETAEPAAEETVEAPAAEAEEAVEETVEVTAEPETVRAPRHADLEEMAAKNTYVSVFEKLADTSKPKQDSKPKRRKKNDEEDQYKVSNKELQKKLKASLVNNDNRPIYTEEELEEIEAQQREEEENEYNIDFDEYEDYYDEDNN